MRKLLWVGIAAVALLFAFTVWPTIYRSDRLLIRDSKGRGTYPDFPVRINRFTGDAERLTLNGWAKLEPAAPAAIAGQPAPKKFPGATVKDLLRNPDFRKLSIPEQLHELRLSDPEFDALPLDQQFHALDDKRYQPSPP